MGVMVEVAMSLANEEVVPQILGAVKLQAGRFVPRPLKDHGIQFPSDLSWCEVILTIKRTPTPSPIPDP